jgi:hypothetical protein
MIYLKAADEATFNQGVVDAGWTYQEAVLESDGEVTVTNYYTAAHSLDVIGVIHVETGNMLTDDNGGEYPEMEPIEGWHANLLLHGEELPAPLDPFVIEAPSTPHRRFA